MALKTILDDSMVIYDLIKKHNDLELQEKMFALKEDIFTQRVENQELREKIKELEEIKFIDSNLILEGNVYYLKGDDQQSRPFCTRCWDVDKIKVTLHFHNKAQGNAICPNCKKSVYGTKINIKK